MNVSAGLRGLGGVLWDFLMRDVLWGPLRAFLPLPTSGTFRTVWSCKHRSHLPMKHYYRYTAIFEKDLLPHRGRTRSSQKMYAGRKIEWRRSLERSRREGSSLCLWCPESTWLWLSRSTQKHSHRRWSIPMMRVLCGHSWCTQLFHQDACVFGLGLRFRWGCTGNHLVLGIHFLAIVGPIGLIKRVMLLVLQRALVPTGWGVISVVLPPAALTKKKS